MSDVNMIPYCLNCGQLGLQEDAPYHSCCPSKRAVDVPKRLAVEIGELQKRVCRAFLAVDNFLRDVEGKSELLWLREDLRRYVEPTKDGEHQYLQGDVSNGFNLGSMKNIKPIPISEARNVAETYGYDQVIIYARKVGEDPKPHGEHLTTYGVNAEHCDVAARIGDYLKYKIFEWTDDK